jgi:hypothetical protein
VGNIFADEPLRVEYATVEDWMGELSTAIEPAPRAETNELGGFADSAAGRLAVGFAVANQIAMRWTDRPTCEPPPVPVYDISPLANLATAVAWGMALERVVTEWRAWHPAARVSWDLADDEVSFTFFVEGVGEVHSDALVTWDAIAASYVDDVLYGARVNAALAMAPHYVAPTPKPANRDAALRRFADGVSR